MTKTIFERLPNDLLDAEIIEAYLTHGEITLEKFHDLFDLQILRDWFRDGLPTNYAGFESVMDQAMAEGLLIENGFFDKSFYFYVH